MANGVCRVGWDDVVDDLARAIAGGLQLENGPETLQLGSERQLQ